MNLTVAGFFCLVLSVLFCLYIMPIMPNITSVIDDVALAKLKSENPFKMKRLNAIWGKATKILKSDRDMINFYGDLAIQDRIEYTLKQEKALIADENGVEKDIVDKKLFAVLLKYDLSRIYPENLVPVVNQGLQDFDEFYFEAIKKDKKLAQLWEQASNIGFIEEELEILKSELIHYLERLKEYEKLREEVENYDGTRDNSIPVDVTQKTLETKNSQMKSSHMELQSIYNKVQSQLSEKISKQTNSVSDYRVAQLRHMAIKANMSERELDILQGELDLLDKQIQKHHHHLREAAIAKLHTSSGEQADMSWAKLDERAKDHGKKVKRLLHELKIKLLNRFQHVEL